MNIAEINKRSWDRKVAENNEWTLPVAALTIEKARNGDWGVVLTPRKTVPRSWFPDDLCALKVLCLASGGGQQGPVLAAAGCDVTVFDLSPKQLEQDEKVAKDNNLKLRTVQGDMRDLSMFAAGSFDLIFHPASNAFVDDISLVWKECSRVLKKGGVLLSGFTNPVLYIFDLEKYENGLLEVKNSLPYSDLESMSPIKLEQFVAEGNAVEFSHTLEKQIGGQTEQGFAIIGFYEDSFGGVEPIDAVMDAYIATRAIKL